MIDTRTIKKLKKLLNPHTFRFIVILYNNTNEIEEIKTIIKGLYPHTDASVYHNYISQGFLYINDFNGFMDDDKHYPLFNQTRDKIAKNNTNIIAFYPKKLKSSLHRKASDRLPDFWEFRSPLLELQPVEDTKETIKDKAITESSSYSSLGGNSTKEKNREIERLEEKLKNTTLLELKINIIEQLARLYYEVGKYESAMGFTIQGLEFKKTNLGENHPDTATSYHTLALLYQSMGEYKKAEPLYLKAQKIREESLGENHPDTATSYNNLALLYKSMGEYKKAEPLYLKAQKIREESLGANHPDTATSYNNLALLYQSMGEYKKAEPLYLKAQKSREESLGENHPTTASSYNNLASLYYAMGEYKKAEPLYLKAQKSREESLGENHPDTATSYNNLGVLYYHTGDYQKSYDFMKRALEVLERVLPATHPNIQSAKDSLDAIEQKIDEV